MVRTMAKAGAAVIFGAAVSLSLQAATSGSYYGAAAEIKAGGQKTVTLTPEWDPDFKEYDDSGDGVFYFKFTAKDGDAYTVTATGGSEMYPIELDVSDKGAYDMDVDVYAPWFDTTVDSDDVSYRSILYRSEWKEDDYDSKVVYFICVSGTAGRSVTVKLVSGEVEEPIPQGSEENPKAISATEGSVKTDSATFVDGSYYYSINLVAGRAYLFGTVGGAEDNLLKLEFDEGELEDGPSYYDYPEWMDEYNDAAYLVPSATGKHLVIVSSDKGGKFSLKYTMLKSLVPEKHAGVLELQDPTSGGVSLQVRPGRRHAVGSAYYDEIIDEDLVKVPLKAGKYYQFAVEGANSNLCLEVYSKGAAAASASVMDVSDPVLAFCPPSDGDYWVGVCQKLSDDINPAKEAAYEACTLTVRAMEKGEGRVDEWDPFDDDYGGASGLAPAPGGKDDNPVESGSAHGSAESPHWLGATDWVDTYVIAARKGLVYKLRTSFPQPPEFNNDKWKISAKVYTVSGNKKTSVKTIADLEEGGEFLAGGNGAYYIDVSVVNGQGRDYGPYILHSLAYDEKGRSLGTLTVNIAGATYKDDGAAWYVASDGTRDYPTYPGGSSILLPAGDDTVKLVDVKGWKKDSARAVKIEAGKVVTVDLKYSDDKDHGDDTAGGATEFKPAAKEAKVSRSLWNDDDADWFKFSAEPGTHYFLALQESSKLGDAVIEVLAADKNTLVSYGRDASFTYRGTAKATYYAKVSHSTSAKADSQYVMAYSRTQMGTVGFDKTSYSAKDSAASVSLKVKRSGGKEGAIRVKYTTVAGTALPGVHYYPQTNVLSWAANDNKDKTITVRLIPDLVAHYESDRSFGVAIEPLDAAELATGELAPLVSAARASVTITDSSKKTVGTVQFGAWGPEDAAFGNAKKPSARVLAGDSIRMRLDRVGGSDGRISVTVTPAKGTAAPDVNYVQESGTFVWESGDDSPRYYSLATIDTGDDFQPDKALTLKLAADKSAGDAPKLGPAASVTIGDPSAGATLASYAAGVPKSTGMSIKEGKAGTWCFTGAGDLSNIPLAAGAKAELTVTLSGPGKFVCSPAFSDGGSGADVCTVTIGKEKPVDIPAEGMDIVRYIPKGSTTVKFSVTRAKKASESSPSLCFADMGGGAPFLWKPLPLPGLIAPVDGERPVADCEDKVKLMWSGSDDPDVVYLFYLDENQKKLGTADARFSSDNEGGFTEDLSRDIAIHCDDCGGAAFPNEIYARKWYYWRVDSAFVEGNEIKLRNVNPSVWKLYALPCEDTPVVKVVSGVDASGERIADIEAAGSVIPVTLVQGVAVDIELGAEGGQEGGTDGFSVAKGCKMPAGMTCKGARIVGAPTKTGESTLVVQLTRKLTAGKSTVTVEGGTVAFRFNVVPPGLAAGDFSGILETDDSAVTGEGGSVASTAAMTIGSFSASVKDAGKISASVTVGGTAYKFAADSWGACVDALDNGLPGVTVSITNSSLKLKVGSKTVSASAVLTMTACRGASDDPAAVDTPMDIALTLPFVSNGVAASATWTGSARRNNAKVASVLAGEADFAGYHTIALSPVSAPDYYGGHGYLTATIDAKKSVAKVAGVLADGATKISCSAVASFVSEGESGGPEVVFPVYYGKGSVAFGGWVLIRLDDCGVPVVTHTSPLRWINASASATYGGDSGFSMVLEPTGGFYDTVVNLQSYYLNYEFGIDDVSEGGLPAELLGSNAAVVSCPGLYDDVLSVEGNAVSAPKQSKVMRADDKKLVDWEKTVNPSNLSISFKRATGVYSGKFEMWGGNADPGKETKQTKLGTYSYQGVLLLSRDPEAVLLPAGPETVVAPGSCIVPVKVTTKRTWNAALPFEIRLRPVVYDWDIEWL